MADRPSWPAEGPDTARSLSSRRIASALPAPPLGENVVGVGDQAEMQRHHGQSGVFEIFVGAAHQVARDDHAVIVVAGVERCVENAAVRETAIEHERFHAHVAQQKIEIGRIESRQPPLGLDDQIVGRHAGDELGPGRAFDSMGIAVGDLADIEREGAPPRGAHAFESSSPPRRNTERTWITGTPSARAPS